MKTVPYFEATLGYTYDELVHHLELQFQPGMSWDNYGREWTIDHKVAVKHFEFSQATDQGFRECWALTNLQPLWKADNRRKGVKRHDQV